MPGPIVVPGRYAHTTNIVAAGGTLYSESAAGLLLLREPWQPPSRLQPQPEIPQTVPGLRLWLAADKLGGLAGGAAVATWPDSSGRGNDATQTTAAAQPTYQTGVVNGLPVVRFDITGTADWMNLATADLLAATNAVGGISFFAVAKMSATAATTNDYLSIGNGTVGSAARMKAGQRAGTAGVWGMTVRRLDGDAAASLEDSADDTSWHVHAAVMDYSTGAATLYVDGAQVATNPSLTAAGTTQATNALVAAVGARGDGLGEFWPGDIAELICYVGATAVSASDRDMVTNYLLAKYAISPAAAAAPPVFVSQYSGRW